MGKMKLTYFGVRARAEIQKLVMAYSKTDYDYVQVDSAAWAKLKPSMLTSLHL